MRDTEQNNWLEKLEVTDSIKGIMDFVDELSHNYDKRVAALHTDYQKDVEEILACYRGEKQEFTTQLQEQQEIIDTLKSELAALRQNYNKINVEYKITSESLQTAKDELSQLTKALKQEDELVAIATNRIKQANEQLRQDLLQQGVEPAPTTTVPDNNFTSDKPRKIRFRRTKAFWQQIVLSRISRPIILRPKNKEPIINTDEEQSQSQDEYSF